MSTSNSKCNTNGASEKSDTAIFAGVVTLHFLVFSFIDQFSSYFVIEA